MKRDQAILFSGGASGTEAHFGQTAEDMGIIEVNFTFEGHEIERTRGLRVLNPKELKLGDTNIAYVSGLLNRSYTRAPLIRKIFQTIWYQIHTGQEIFIVGEILPDNTIKGGTGWGAELAKLTNKPLYVFDQTKNAWFCWLGMTWRACEEPPCITEEHFTGTGTRALQENGREAITALFARSFED